MSRDENGWGVDGHYHVGETTTYGGIDDTDSSPAFDADEAIQYLRRRANRVGVDLMVDDFEGEHRATWTIRRCTSESCETKEEAFRFYEQVYGGNDD